MKSQTVRVHDLDVHYLEEGSGPPVLLLHGWPTNAQLWRHVLPAVAAGRRAIAIDLPGFGQSSKPADLSYSFRLYDKVLDGFLEALGIDRVGLVVHDLGGPIGLHWAATRQARITDLVLLNTLVFPEMSWAVKVFVAGSYLPGISHAMASGWGLAAAMRFGVVDKGRITSEVEQIYQEPFPTRSDRKALLAAAHGLHPRGFDTIVASLHDYRVPVRLLYGERDRILPDVASTMARVKAAIPHAELSSIPDCGHFLQEDQPEQVATLLAEFLMRSHEAAS
jgi:pimeloyl-ACP methyl ester carboxylesterase